MAMAAPWSPPSRCPATASTSAPRLLAPTPSRLSTRSFRQPGTSRRRQLSVRATAAAPPPPPVDFADPDPGSGSGADADYIASLKVKLLSAVAGLNRGLAASAEDLSRADAAARALESAGGGVDLAGRDLDKLQGRWRLVYSSAFSSGTLGGSRPGPPTGRLLPVTLGQVFQRIDVVGGDLDNVVELELGAPWPLPPVEAVATLAHRMEVVGAAGVRIVFERTTVKTKGTSLLAQLPPLEVPRIPDSLRPPPSSSTGSGEFELTYLDGDTCGDGGEHRAGVRHRVTSWPRGSELPGCSEFL